MDTIEVRGARTHNLKNIDVDIPRDQLSGPLRRGAVKKHVAAIHVSGKLTLLQRKLSNVLLLNAYDTLSTKPKHEIDARTLCLMIGYNSNDMETLKQSLRGLAETVAEWDMLDDKGRQNRYAAEITITPDDHDPLHDATPRASRRACQAMVIFRIDPSPTRARTTRLGSRSMRCSSS